jgi:predicted O-methyltransferase YrrM
MIAQLFDEILRADKRVIGWASITKQIAMASAVVALRPDISMEIGVYGGKSFFPMAFAHRAIGRGRVIGIDPWNGPESAKGQIANHAQYWSTLNHGRIYHDFMRQRKEFGLESVTEIIRFASDDYDPSPGISVLSIDGNHGPQAIKDVERYAPMVKMGGLVFCDDLAWDGSDSDYVAQSLEKLTLLGFVEKYRVQNKAQGGNDDWGCWQKIH